MYCLGADFELLGMYGKVERCGCCESVGVERLSIGGYMPDNFATSSEVVTNNPMLPTSRFFNNWFHEHFML